MRNRLLYLFSLYLLFSLSSAFGQTDRGTITGAVSDPTGAVVPNVSIQVRNVDTGALFQGGASATGNYVIPVPRGTYELTVTVSGFKKYVRQNLEVPVATTVRWDVKLEVGATTEAITVTESTPLLKTESGDVSHSVTSERANNLPVLTLNNNIRNPLQIVNLLPGSSFASDNTLRINGLPANTQAIRIEGQDATNGIWKEQTQIAQSSLDAIQEVAIQTSNYAAEFGQAGGGYFNFTMKSGTNQYHGSGYDYFVNEFLNAGTPYTSNGSGEHLRNRQRRTDYGITFGGPIRIPKIYNGRDKTFFFFNFEQYREATLTTTAIQTVPTAAYQAGDFTQANAGLTNVTWTGCPKDSAGNCLDPLNRIVPQNGIYDPNTTTTTPSGFVVRNLFAPFNQIPLTRMDPISLKVQGYLPRPLGANATQLINNYAVPGYASYTHTTNPSIKLDHSISSTIKLSGYYSRNARQSPNSNGIAPPITSALPTNDASQTIRVNYDQTVTPTLLLHLGVGYLYTYNPTEPVPFDQSTIGLKGFYANLFPNVNGLSTGTKGGNTIGISVGGGFPRLLWDQKPTANASLTWVKNNHTYKLGGELVIEGFPSHNLAYGHGVFNFSAAQTSLPYENSVTGRIGSTGFNYASFLLGGYNGLSVSQPWFYKLGNHAVGMFIQDTWKVTRRLTLDYGLRYDYQTYLKEQYGRMSSMSFDTMNPTVGRPGAVIFEGDGPGRCNCQFGSNYPYAIGPRISVAYQINSRTVLRTGIGVSYGTAPENAQLSYNVGDFYNINPPGYGIAVANISQGNTYAEGNPYGNPPIRTPNFDPGQFPVKTVTGLPPASPFRNIDRNAGRPPRILSWSFGLQRELRRDLVVEASYVGNRGAWWTAPALQDMNYNALRPQELLSRYGIDVVNSATDRTLLTTPIGNPLTGIISPVLTARGLGRLPYAGFPLGQNLNQTLRPFPQFGGINPFLGPPLGHTWYDSLQAKVTKRYSHGLDVQAAFTWQKELTLGSNASTSYFTPGALAINDVFNRDANKQISSLSRPFQVVISGTYTTPKTGGSGWGFKVLSEVVRDWQIGTVLRYQSGAMIRVPSSNNSLLTQLAATGLAGFFGGATNWNRVPGQPLFLNSANGQPIDPNCRCFDPTRQLVLNPAAWTDAPAGQFGATAPYLSEYRWQRQPSEAINFGRNFRVGPERKYNLQIRAEFQNALNRLFLFAPSNTNPALTTTCFGGVACAGQTTGQPFSGGYGYVNTTNGLGSSPRRGQIVARFTF